jgi:hypothetical protein
MEEPSSYGKRYWCVKIPQALSDGTAIEATLADATEIYLYADSCTIHRSGALEFTRVDTDEKTGEQATYINFALAPGEWVFVYEAATSDRGALAVET